MTASQLVVPVVLWGRDAPTHCISSVLMTPDAHTIATGCNDGQICLWNVSEDWKVTPHCMLFGHTAAVNCLCMGSNQAEKPYLVSSSDNGEMCLWDLGDGRCIEHKKHQMVHTSIQAYQMMHCRDVRLVCNGYYTDIHIIHPSSLDILFTLSSRMQPDWISALSILRPVKREDDVIVAISNSGMVKVWTLTGNESKSTQPIYENEAKQIRCLNAQTLRCCAYNQRTVLIVCSKYWQIYSTDWTDLDNPSQATKGIYDAGDFSLLCSESSRCGERWAGGEFISVDRVVVWSNEGRGYLYKLPMNCHPESESFHCPADPSSPRQHGPQAYNVLDLFGEKSLECSPTMAYFLGRREHERKLLLRGDSEGRLVVWVIPDIHEKKMRLVRQESFEKLPVGHPKCCTSLQEAWETTEPPPQGIIDQLNDLGERTLQITATIYIPSCGRLVCGRDDGTIVIVPAVEAIVLKLLINGKPEDSLNHQILQGHNGRVNCLLYPCNDSARYDPAHLLSGGVDFTVLLWDMNTGTKLHTFCVHGGEVQQLLVPPAGCNPRILPCVCSVASDHSLALLSVKERKCIMLAARQLFPIVTVKWRPHDDFLLVACTDGTVYVWQMETGHLDRVVHGVTAEDILSACDEVHLQADIPVSGTSQGDQLMNPTISIAQALRRRNLATFRNLAQQQLQKAQEALQSSGGILSYGPASHPSLLHRPHAAPMMIQGLRTNSKDPDSHVFYFDIEALIVQLLNEEYSLLSPSTLESLGFNVGGRDQGQPVEAHKKVADFFAKVKDKAENVGQKIQTKAEIAGLRPISPRLDRKTINVSPKLQRKQESGKKPPKPPPPKLPVIQQSRPLTLTAALSLVMEITRLFMSCHHAWNSDADLDKLCMGKLGMMSPKRPLSFGTLSRGGHMALLLPTWYKCAAAAADTCSAIATATSGHWQISSAITTHHLLSVISVANTLMGMTNATFRPEESNKPSSPNQMDHDTNLTQQAHTKQGWSLLAALHCVLLPDLVGRNQYQPPQLEMLARRWQDRCLEIREAAQALLLAELRRIGPEGRKKVVDQWSPFLPSYVDPSLSLLTEHNSNASNIQDDTSPQNNDIDEDDNMLGSEQTQSPQTFESRRKQATAIVMMGVLGAEFGAEIEPSKLKTTEEQSKKKIVEGFGLTKYSHAMHTSKALTFLLLHPPSSQLPSNTPIRRAAVDLLGRGFTVWEPFLDVSAVLLGMLELCIDGDKLVPSMTFGLPLCPAADACRTARHSLSLIATARPPAFIITMAKEVARYNALAQNTQGQAHAQQLQHSVLMRSRMEIIRVIEMLVEKIPHDVADLLVEVMDITVHCLDQNAVKMRGLHEVFPAICRFSIVSYCNNTRRIAVGAKNGGMALYDLKQSKCQILPAHSGSVSAVAFSPDGKFMASYSLFDYKLLFWQTASSSLFGIGSHQTKCVKTYNTPPITIPPNTNPLKLVKLVWVDTRTVVLLTADGKETRFRV